ncbi:YccF domain-containing protein [Corynebacterium mendelii]|uniref:YccF domain-containing protein n=1 Tax=Corynebacterium mendelii TaxID=2765362 RepID=A0A939E2Q6_9CORY|nr:YccF domain-containing protein [Corynebacterium mendelii]MBN9644688.1 YccF domain-containing protein [Corynebacterium mendelii]
MKAILNILWLVTGGLWLALGYFLFGLVACVLIVTFPIGVASMRMASYALWPFGREVVDTGKAGVVTGVANAIWFIFGGLWMAIGHIGTAAAQAVTIIGIPLAIANIKLIPVTCFPYGKKIVPAGSVANPAAAVKI